MDPSGPLYTNASSEGELRSRRRSRTLGSRRRPWRVGAALLQTSLESQTRNRKRLEQRHLTSMLRRDRGEWVSGNFPVQPSLPKSRELDDQARAPEARGCFGAVQRSSQRLVGGIHQASRDTPIVQLQEVTEQL